MIKKIILMVICFLLPNIVLADEVLLHKNAPSKYVVKKGDTLWDISGVFLEQPWLWPKIWRLNPAIENPHLIYPGDELSLVYDENGSPMLVKVDDNTSTPNDEDEVGTLKSKPAYKWSPKSRITLKEQNPVTSIPLHVIAPFIKYNTILSVQDIDSSPYVIGGEEGYKSNIDGFKTYINGDLVAGKAYAVYKKGRPIIDPETEQVIAYHATLTGTGKALRAGNKANKEPATLFVEGATREIRATDILKPVNEGQLLPSLFTMQAASPGLTGSIIETSTGLREFGKLEVVYLNRGAQDSVKQGDILTVERLSPSIIETDNGPEYVKDTSRWAKLASDTGSEYKMPTETVGQMMVFKVFDQISMALILNSEKPLRLQDTFSAP
ncbi:LysM peptidoglycan-binding domain-containing protein [Thalassotalea profundi]|uniref:Peptidoglycan-binding protein LysM n=1 Tax=Thalassotalea profundi TaxID=2036687 RepID=A0ABQ3J098_9GAMM|nr:LysM peptidoglycan-binding domain-containing protein [Thalassotalea profundi]GHE96411.1 peptidoglycan-binding protein LysM [Thalassotalea profundi]